MVSRFRRKAVYVSVPLRGLVVFNTETAKLVGTWEANVSVPLRGLVVFNGRTQKLYHEGDLVSVPLRGLVIFN